MFAAGFIKNISQTQNLLRSNPEKLLANKVVRAIANSENEPFQAGILSRAAQADEPVTTDVKRLIRHPGSLHGGSGMRVVPIPHRSAGRVRSFNRCGGVWRAKRLR